jgi:two pore calcium channel protein 1/two pore calcium channel protein 3
MDFESFFGAYLLLISTFIAAEWSAIVFDLSYRMGSMAIPVAFMGSFVFLSIFLQALLGGLVWEVFNVVSLTLKSE